jgi:hypothetical protein
MTQSQSTIMTGRLTSHVKADTHHLLSSENDVPGVWVVDEFHCMLLHTGTGALWKVRSLSFLKKIIWFYFVPSA